MTRAPALSTRSIADTPGSRAMPFWFLGLFAAAGVLLYLVCAEHDYPDQQRYQNRATLVVLAIAYVPFFNRYLTKLFNLIRHPSPFAVQITTVVITLLAARYFLYTAVSQHRELIPKYHDEQMYTIQARLVATGHLWLPLHPLAEFFETFHVLVRPVYAPIYFPGTAMLFAPAIWLGVSFPFWATLLAGMIVGLGYRIGTELFDGVAGIVAAVMLVTLSPLHFVSVMMMSHLVVLFLELYLIWAWLRWQRWPSVRWELLMGAIAGWAAITRPIDAACIALPVALAAALDLRGKPLKQWARVGIAVLIGAIPFLVIQGIMNIGTTGRLSQTAAGGYLKTYWPGAGMGFAAADPSFRPPTSLRQFQEYYDGFLVPAIDRHAKAGFTASLFNRVAPMMLLNGSAATVVLLLLPMGLLGLKKRRWVVAISIPLFVICYACYPFVLRYYSLAITPAIIILSLAAIAVLNDRSAFIGTGITVALIAACATSTHELNPWVHDPDFPKPLLVDVRNQLAGLKEKAVVLFPYDGGGSCHDEPVYNTDVAWPDDAPVIRAHDLGSHNLKLFVYYAKLDPSRAIYRYDRKTGSLERLGTAADLSKKGFE